MIKNFTKIMIQEAYVSLEVAKLLKEKGFDIPLKTNYISENTYYLMPTHQMALAWLREKYQIYITVQPCLHETYEHGTPTGLYETMKHEPTVGKWDDNGWDIDVDFETKEYLNYEDATEAAIKYTLENLI